MQVSRESSLDTGIEPIEAEMAMAARRARRLRVWTRSRWILLLPLLVIYLAVSLAAQQPGLVGDESRYVRFATNLTQGYYSDPDRINLWNGPGYPIILAPFAAAGGWWTMARALNAFLLFWAVLYFHRALRLYLPDGAALGFALALGLTPPLLRQAHLLSTEPLAHFLVCAFIYHLCRLHQGGGRRHLAASALALGWLTLTKVFFAYVLVAVALALAAHLLVRRQREFRTLQVFALALLLCLPYLAYTYRLTGKIFYWGNSGGTTLYWMSTPFPGELGDWNGSPGQLRDHPALKRNHGDYFDKLAQLPPLAQDAALKQKALQNIREHPIKYLQNWLANVGRLLFSYPFSYAPQKLSTAFYLLPGMFVVVGFALALPLALRGRRLVPVELNHLLLTGGVSFFGASLISAYQRQFQVLLPFFLIWMAFLFTQVAEIRIKTGGDD